MLRSLKPEGRLETDDADLFPLARPLVEASRHGASVRAALEEIVRGFGFDGFLYGISTAALPMRDSRTFVWTNAQTEWIDLYDQRGYIEVDPRPTLTQTNAVPRMWDRSMFSETKALRGFFETAARYGVRSGVTIGLYNPRHGRAGFWLTSGARRLDNAAQSRICESFGDLLVVANFVHGFLMRDVVNQHVPLIAEDTRLSSIETQCLQLAARGSRNRQIAAELQIGVRAVYYHISRLLGKLGASNRTEAIARAISLHLIEP